MKSKSNRLFIFSIVISTIGFGCIDEYPDDRGEYFREQEEIWERCYNNRFKFPDDEQILAGDFLKCNLNGKDVLINSTNSHYGASIYYIFSFTTTSPTIEFGNTQVTRQQIDIGFRDVEYLKGFSIAIEYKQDSLNYFVQKALSTTHLEVAGNMVENKPEFYIKTSCTPNGAVYFSTLPSQKTQAIKIDKFDYRFIDGKWHYSLEYSFDELELINGSFNFDKKLVMESDVIVEQIIVTDFKCSLNFELPPG